MDANVIFLCTCGLTTGEVLTVGLPPSSNTLLGTGLEDCVDALVGQAWGGVRVRHPDWRVPHLVSVCVCVCGKLTKQWMLCERGPTVTGLLGEEARGWSGLSEA